MKRLLISLVAVFGLLVLTDTVSASHRSYRGSQRGFSFSIGPGYYGGGYYSGYRGGFYGRPSYWGNGYYGGGYYYAPPYYYSTPGAYCAPQGAYYYGSPSLGIIIGR